MVSLHLQLHRQFAYRVSQEPTIQPLNNHLKAAVYNVQQAPSHQQVQQAAQDVWLEPSQHKAHQHVLDVQQVLGALLPLHLARAALLELTRPL